MRIWKTPKPIDESPELIECWVENLTGMRLDDRNVPRFLDATGLNERQARSKLSVWIDQLRSNYSADPE